ncbi:uncharacterized protein PRCAT00006162001 [Priceomyces carsonii]|uniref:uncharacterized protein n=1 Tax=Priceomyces carsonii TaxID=28549 RepID=UPI002ED92929|nr:unnamed protein product [Priceomyces carsonii]
MPCEVLIIGGSFAALAAADMIFKLSKETPTKVTLVSASSKSFFCVASPRLIIEPENIEKTYFSVEKAFKRRSNGKPCEFIQGTVTSSDFSTNSVQVLTAKGERKLTYDYLIIASGSSSENASFKLKDDYQTSIEAAKTLSSDAAAAQSICVIGGGSTGVEVAGELGFSYGTKKKIKLFTGSKGPLSFLGQKASDKALKLLQSCNVEVVNTKISSYEKDKNGYVAKLSDGSSEKFDLIIPASGLKPNSQFIDDEFLDSQGYLLTDEHFRVKKYHNVLALGDILSIGESSFVDIKFYQRAVFESAVRKEIFGEEAVTLKAYKSHEASELVPITRKSGVGKVFGWSVPSWVIWYLKSRDFLLRRAGEELT